jgi:hypothetical protein
MLQFRDESQADLQNAPAGTPVPLASPPAAPTPRPSGLLAKTLGKRIQKGLRRITSEAQDMAEDLQSGLRRYEQELVISALEASRRDHPRPAKVALDNLPDRLSRRIKRLGLIADEVKTLVDNLVVDLKPRLEARGLPFAVPGREPAPKDLKSQLVEYERGLILSALEACGMNQLLAAKALGVLPTTLSEKMKRLQLRRSVRRQPG